MLTLNGCNRSHADQHDDAVQSVAIDSAYEDVAIPEVLDNTSDIHFDRAVSDLQKHNHKQAAIELKVGIDAYEKEAQIGGTSPAYPFEKQLAKMRALVPQVEAGKATADAVQFVTEVGELLVAHDRIEKLETMPLFTAKTNLHMRQVLEHIEKNTAHLSQNARQEGTDVIKDARTALSNLDKAAKSDTQNAEKNVRLELDKVKSFIKRNS
ncbi:hypothetical protein GCM10027190_44390 [Spirosoma areae]